MEAAARDKVVRGANVIPHRLELLPGTGALIETVRAEARKIDKDLPLYDIKTIAALRSETMAQRRFILALVVAFGALALGARAMRMDPMTALRYE